MSRSVAWPLSPRPEISGWCMWIRALGSAKRRPFDPAISRTVPKLAARPTLTVEMGALTYCMVS